MGFGTRCRRCRSDARPQSPADAGRARRRTWSVLFGALFWTGKGLTGWEGMEGGEV